MKKIYIVLALLWATQVAIAQNNTIKGKVIATETNKPLANATVTLKGGSTTTTDGEGLFTIACAENAEIVVSYVGFATFSQKAECGKELTISLVASVNSLNEVEITATSTTHKEMLYQPVSIARINPLEIKRGNGLLMDDAINTNIAGVSMQRRTFSAGQQFNIRGYGNGARGTNGVNSNFDTQGTKVYLNGIPVTDAEGITLMDDIDFGSIGNVEIQKGPSGTLYGLAIAGVVNLRTLTPPANQTSVGQEVIVGSYGLRRFTTSLQMNKEKSTLLVNYGKQLYDGFMNHTASNKDFLNIFGSVNPNKKQIINYYLGMSNSYDERNGELTKAQYDAFDYSGNPNYIKNNAHSAVKTVRAGIGHTYNFTDNIANSTSLFGTGLVSDVSSAGGWTDKSYMNYGLRSTFDTKFNLGSTTQLSGITGVEMQAQTAQTAAYAMVTNNIDPKGYNVVGAMRSSFYTTTQTLSAFSEWTLALPADISVTAGLGYSVMSIELNDRLYIATNNTATQRIPTNIAKTYDGMVSPRIALNKVFNKQISGYASYSQGYKAPTSSYFYIPLTGQLVPNLKPEQGTQYEIGVKGNVLAEKLNFQIALFSTEFSNKMTVVAVPNPANTATLYTYMVNGGSQFHKGLEVALRGIVYQSAGCFKNVSVFGNFTYSDFKYGDNFKFQQIASNKVTEADFSNKVVVGTPPVVFNLGVDVATNLGVYGNITYSQRDPMYYTSDNLNQTTTNKLLNAKVGFRRVIAQRVDLDFYVAANNITGNQNYAMVFSNQLPDAYLPAPREINYFSGLTLRYLFLSKN